MASIKATCIISDNRKDSCVITVAVYTQLVAHAWSGWRLWLLDRLFWSRRERCLAVRDESLCLGGLINEVSTGVKIIPRGALAKGNKRNVGKGSRRYQSLRKVALVLTEDDHSRGRAKHRNITKLEKLQEAIRSTSGSPCIRHAYLLVFPPIIPINKLVQSFNFDRQESTKLKALYRIFLSPPQEKRKTEG
ncbi:uncharacterized protein LOC135089025 [Scylla paramamosain]|uniref:uncharacterized protein LOC135089025 n=1 Tax=Scylla paramamosain TaxID=85552 RepID=UPI00308326DE